MSEESIPGGLSVQLALPEGFGEHAGFRRVLELLRRLEFTGVELNIQRFDAVSPTDVERLLEAYGLQLRYFASGLTAKAEGLALSAPDEGQRRRSVQRCLDMIDFTAGFPGPPGIIIGFLKGPAGQEAEAAARRLSASLAALTPQAERRRVTVLLEATNRYESAAANTLEQAAGLVAPLGSAYAQILPDTYHMNIEERDPAAALRSCAPYYRSVHLSDNNRLLPGLGAIDFGRVLGWLRSAGYRGGLALEGNIRADLLEDIEASARHLAPLLQL